MMYGGATKTCGERRRSDYRGGSGSAGNVRSLSMAREIKLSQGQVAIVDDEDFEWLSRWKWHAYWNKNTKSFYAQRNIRILKKTICIIMHRLIMGLNPKERPVVDHINHDTLNNTRNNLRVTTPSGNQQNRLNRGYAFHKKSQKFRARITANGKDIYLGIYKNENDARKAYLAAKEIYHPFRVIA